MERTVIVVPSRGQTSDCPAARAARRAASSSGVNCALSVITPSSNAPQIEGCELRAASCEAGVNSLAARSSQHSDAHDDLPELLAARQTPERAPPVGEIVDAVDRRDQPPGAQL